MPDLSTRFSLRQLSKYAQVSHSLIPLGGVNNVPYTLSHPNQLGSNPGPPPFDFKNFDRAGRSGILVDMTLPVWATATSLPRRVSSQ